MMLILSKGIVFLAGIHEMYILFLNSTVIKSPLLNKIFDTRLVINTVNWLRSGHAIFRCSLGRVRLGCIVH